MIPLNSPFLRNNLPQGKVIGRMYRLEQMGQFIISCTSSTTNEIIFKLISF
jgi:hypothetical protein